jgi:undecaprenyl-diphosphatase
MKIAESDFSKSFDIIIQLGAILAVLVLFHKKFTDRWLLKKLAVAFVPTGIIGLAFYKIVKTYFLGNEQVVLWALLLGGLAMLIFEFLYQSKFADGDNVQTVTFKQAFIIGLCQSLSIIPGVSRSAATIMGGMAVGLSRQTIVEFSFLLAVPTMLAATGLDLVKNHSVFSSSNLGVLGVGLVISFIVALLAIKFLINFVQKHSFTPFALYRIVLAIVFFLLVF